MRQGELRRIAIVNRGEAAIRLINAVRELRHETGDELRTIALYTAAERTAMFVREADEAVCLDVPPEHRPDPGPPGHRPDPGGTSPYLDLVVLERALLDARADAAWVGWGFVAERPEFAELCERIGVVFVGPTPDVMRKLGDKIGAKRLAEEAEVPVAPWSGGPVDDIDDALANAERIGYPLMIKATAGGGGRGIRRVDRREQLAEAFESARSEGAKAFGDPTVFMERVVTDARHVEVQIIADHYGHAWAVGVRDCSMQRRNQKVVEESHCSALTPAQDAELRAAAVRLVELAHYTNAGTVEFLYQPSEQRFSFLEVNTRLQVEHPVTELTTGVDLVKLQLHVAAGGHLDGDPPSATGYAIEARLNAEDPQRGFAPAPGLIETMALPVGPGVRVDTGVAEGDVIPPEYDSMIAKVIAYGRDRAEAIARLRRALTQMVVIIRGGTTNKAFLLDLLGRPEVLAGDIDTGWLDRLTAAGQHLPTRHADVALVVAAVDAADQLRDIDRSRFLSWASRGRPQVDPALGHDVELRQGPVSYRVHVRQLGPGRHAVQLGPATVVVDVERLGRARSRATIGERAYVVVSSTHDSDHLVDVDGVIHRFSRDDAGIVRAPATALVVRVDVEKGAVVAAGDRLAVVEAMKMEIAIPAPISGRVSDVFVARNVQVDAGVPLVRIEGSARNGVESATAAPSISLDALAATSEPDAGRDPIGTLRAFMLGYDVPATSAKLATTFVGPAVGNAATDMGEFEVLHVFADLCALSPERRADDELSGSREYFNSYLRSLDVEREGIPSWFVDRLLRAVAHYGIADLERTPRLEDVLLHAFQAQQRREDQTAVVLDLLEARLASEDADGVPPGLREALDRLIDATQRRHPAVASMARAVRHRYVDRPIIERHRADVMDAMRIHIAALNDRDETDAEVRAEHVPPLAACPLPLMPVLTENDLFAATKHPGVLLEVLMRRYYKIRLLEGVGIETVDGFELACGQYRRNERRVAVISVRTKPDELDRALAAVAARVSATETDGVTTVVDIYLTFDATGIPDADSLSIELRKRLEASTLPQSVRRVAVIGSQTNHIGGTQQLTFRRAGGDADQPYWMPRLVPGDNLDRFAEDRKFRGLHPMIARRLQMWRLSNFDIARLPSVDDVYAYECTARENAADRRLIAVAEVRDVTPVRDDRGRVIALPDLEHALVGCLDAIRAALSSRHDRRRLEWNRVMLYVWPVVDFTADEMLGIARRLAPMTEGLGLEQIVVSGRLLPAGADEPVEAVMRLSYEPGHGLTTRITEPPTEPMQPVDDFTRQRIETRRRGLVHPYELASLLAGPGGTFIEYELDDDPGTLVAIDRPPGRNVAGVVVGTVTTPTDAHPDGMIRVAILGDATKAMGSITEMECRRILAAIDLAESIDVPIEWFALSAGAKIAMDSGSENLDWVARVLRRLVEHTQRGGRDGGRVGGRDGGRVGGEVNVVVAGINVGAQPYWNAEATMLMHTRGILVMTPDSAMVLTGKQAIDYSGGVSAEDNLGIGGYARVMGPNGEAQYFAPTLAGAIAVLFDHYRLTYRAPGERWPAPVTTSDPVERDVRSARHDVEGTDFTTVGDIFSDTANPDRKKPFDIRTVIRAVIDADHRPLERWPEMADAETAVVYDARLGGHAVSVLGVESRPLPRHGLTPADGPAQWSAGTLFPLSSKKVARAINAASGNRPVVMLANLSGFDGSPESLRRLQLEYGAEIGRAIVNFDGPFVLCVVSRYHGGAFVVFSARLNDDMEVLAVEGSFASVIGGAPAAAVVFTREVDERTRRDERVQELEAAVAEATGEEADVRRAELAEMREAVRTEMLGEVAAEFDAIHSVERAKAVGSVHRIIKPADLRPELIAAVERGIERVDARLRGG